ncbi:hypothetical protein K432DRAFT_428802 [Lepidopterella palustris CBS 459.81]|uniref:CorA-like transporter domain-containing protein n=1 Tax=Lepidopterella palustris CBS 459.81 TaxID=1314670 RepID=A0A8E2E350_9PEZI|nr:hypothetical protein K432DRAFT_428802 [Lepidopterella palustris CBS 459.81]
MAKITDHYEATSSAVDFRDYPLNIARSELDSDDLHLYSKKLEQISATLFVQASAQCQVELWQAGGFVGRQAEWSSKGLFLNSLRALETSWKAGLENGNTSIIIIHRKNSWSRMKILPEMFKYICSSINIHPRFLDFVFEFGRKSSSIDETFISFYKVFSFAASENTQPSSFDICYNLRYFEPHGRQLSDPWSCRQSAIHQKFYFSKGTSAWTIIHQPITFRESLQSAQSGAFSHPMVMHIRYIRSANHHWRDYLNYKSSELLSLDAIISVAKPFSEFQTDFATIQKVHSIRRKLHIAISILDGTSEVLMNLAAHADRVGELMRFSPCVCNGFRTELEQISSDIKSHKSTAQSLLKISDDIRYMSRNVLAFCNQEVDIKNGVALGQLAHAGAADSRYLATMTEETQKDSRTMRIATVIAMVYLPANLVMSFFSTGLVSFHSNEQASTTSSGVNMKIHSQVWIAIFTSLLLAAATMAAVTIWDRLGRRPLVSRLVNKLVGSFT